MQSYLYYCDAAVDNLYRGSGVAVVVRLAAASQAQPASRIIATASRFLGGMTNNEAEYEAFILGLQFAIQRRDRMPIVLSDSQIVIGQVAGCFAVRDRKLQPRHTRARRLLAQLPEATVVFVPRERNLIADALAKETLAEGLAGLESSGGQEAGE